MRAFRVLKLKASDQLSDYGEGETPGPIPNPEVKPSIAESTAV